jgi:hypothetical protein
MADLSGSREDTHIPGKGCRKGLCDVMLRLVENDLANSANPA